MNKILFRHITTNNFDDKIQKDIILDLEKKPYLYQTLESFHTFLLEISNHNNDINYLFDQIYYILKEPTYKKKKENKQVYIEKGISKKHEKKNETIKKYLEDKNWIDKFREKIMLDDIVFNKCAELYVNDSLIKNINIDYCEKNLTKKRK